MKKIAIYTSARSDYGLLRNFIARSADVFSVDILVAGTHHSQSKGMTRHEIEADWGNDARIRMIPVEFMLEDCSAQAQTKSLALAQASLAQWFATQPYDALVILGDRWELFGASLPAMLYGIPVAHISGGEITEGVIDDSIRHAHTKLAHLHFAANEHYAENISRMGEEDWRITVSGECGLDSIHRQDLATPQEIKERFGLSLERKFILVTYHPATLDSDVPVTAQIDSLLQALGHFPDYQIVLTSPGAEKGADQVTERIKKFAGDQPNALFVDNFGSRNYLAVLRNTSVVLGNSSSGLVEAASFGVPAVNVGNRQKNRMAAESVLHVQYDPLAIKAALERALSPAFQQFSRSCINPYDPFRDGRNSERIVCALQNAMTTRSRHELLTKKFNLEVDKSEWNTFDQGFQVSKKVFIIAEAGVNHNGDIKLAYKLIDAAREAGADAVKFQTFKTEKIVTRQAEMADYQKENLAASDSQFEMIKRLELSYDEFRELQSYCKRTGILFLSTPDEEDSLDFLADELDIPWLKIGSGEMNNYPFLRRVASKQKPIILSTGMSTLGEVEIAIRIIRESNLLELVVLHCTTNYPCPMDEVNLKAMLTLKEAFKVRVGYSDHTLGIEVPVAAVALGAEVIEKHFTLDKEMEGPDHKASMDPAELSAMVRAIRNIESALGDGIKRPNASEEKTMQIVRKRLVAACDLPAGRQLSENDLILKRANSGIFAEHAELVRGRVLHAAVKADHPVEWNDLFSKN